MRHEMLNEQSRVDALDVAAVWPATTQIAPLPVPDIGGETVRAQPEAAVPDMPPAAGVMLVGSYVALLGALALATVGGGKSLLAIVIAAFFVFMFFSIPAVFLGVEAQDSPRQSFSRFMSEGIQTSTGHSGGGAALVQMLVVPVSLTLGAIAIAIATAIIF